MERGMKRRQTETLFHRVRDESSKSRYSNAEDIVNSLCLNYPEYRRSKRQMLIRMVEQNLHSINNNNIHDHVKQQRSSMNIDSEEEDYNDVEKDEEEYEDFVISTPCDSDMGLSGTESGNERMLEDEKEKKVKKKKKKKELGFKSLGGMNEIIKDLKTSLMRLSCPELSRELGIKPIGGILLHGLPGCGKTKLAKAIAHELGFTLYSKPATEFVDGVSGNNLNCILVF